MLYLGTAAGVKSISRNNNTSTQNELTLFKKNFKKQMATGVVTRHSLELLSLDREIFLALLR